MIPLLSALLFLKTVRFNWLKEVTRRSLFPFSSTASQPELTSWLQTMKFPATLGWKPYFTAVTCMCISFMCLLLYSCKFKCLRSFFISEQDNVYFIINFFLYIINLFVSKLSIFSHILEKVSSFLESLIIRF